MDADETQANLELIRRHYDSYRQGDIEGIVGGLDDDVCIEVHDERGKSAGEPLRGIEEARTFFDEIREAVTDPTVEVQSLRADGDRVLARVSLGGTLRRTGEAGAIPAVHLFTIHDGLISVIRTHRPNWRRAEAPGP